MPKPTIGAKLRRFMKKPSAQHAKNVAYTLSDIISLLLRVMGTVVLIGITTAMIFTCIFVVYVKANLSDELVVSLEEASLNLSSTLYYLDEDGGRHELVKLQSAEYRIWSDYNEIPLHLEHALVAIEDQRFYEHNGVDWYRSIGAFSNMFLQMRDQFGGSTITQQLIKNLTGDDEVTVARKFQEIFRALDFEKRYKKTEILTWYLNRVYFGGRAYGVAAAADYYFGKSLKDLTLAESASIVGITNNPSKYNPYLSLVNNKARQELILNQMYKQGYISLEECENAKAETLVFKRGENSKTIEDVYTWFEEAVISEVTGDFAALRGISRETAGDILRRGGYSIVTTLNPEIQAKIDAVFTDVENLPKTTGSEQQLQAGIVLVDPYTGYVVGLSGGVGEKTGNLWKNRATDEIARRPPGSSIKPLSVYALAMDLNLITPNTVYDDSSSVVLSGRPDWLPRNSNRDYAGLVTIRQAIISSINTIAAQVLDKLTPAVSFRFLTETLGFKLESDDLNYAPLSIGQFTMGTTPLTMASGYTMFPNGGVRTEATTYTQLIDSKGNVIIDNKPVRTIAVSDTTAYWMTSILTDAVKRGTGSDAYLGTIPTAGKTGTTTDNKDRWFCGYTPYYVAVCWAGYDVPEVIRMRNGGNPAAQIWNRVMESVHEDLPYRDFATPADTYQPPVPGITVVRYTVRYETTNGTEFYTMTETARAGQIINIVAPTLEDYTLQGNGSVSLMVDENPERNVVTFVYAYTPPNTPTPEPSPSPTQTPTPEPSPSPDVSFPPDVSFSPDVSPEPDVSTTPPWDGQL